jgi:Holliday junction resolvasome RuvABC endonuclease subunit
MRCLALDISSRVGWVAFHRPGALAGIGTWHVPDSPRLGERFLWFERWLIGKCREHRPDVLAFEEPIRGLPWRKAGTDRYTTMPVQKLLQGLAAIAELVAAEIDCERCIEVPTSTAKKKLAGHGRADKTMMIAAAIKMGIDVADEHQADALAVALCAYDHVGVPVRGHDGPLLEQLSRWTP